MIFRQAKEQERNVIAGFQQKMALETENYHLNIETVLEGVQAVFDDSKKGKYYIVEEDEKVIASLLTTFEWSDWRNSFVIWIQSVYVLPQYRAKGVFKLMYNEIKKIVSENPNYSGIRLYVDKTNTNAQKVYTKIGMQGEHYSLFEDME
ncbi:MAG: GNAT family N-acetyltransferase [Bacteroidales bacterium]|nr:GNAT family N-acetyltransferase [Bacteroidales bacterium]